MRACISRIALAGVLCAATAGCPALTGLFGATPDEQRQAKQLRGMQQAASRLTNIEIGYVVDALAEVLAIGLPTFYGIDLSPYLASAPWPPAPPANKNIIKTLANNNPQDPDQEIGQIQSSDRQQQLTFLFNNGQTQILPQNRSLTYKVTLDRTRKQGITGTMTVTTTTRTTFTRKVPAATGQPYVFGRNYITTSPSSVNLSITLVQGSRRLADMKVDLSQGSVGTVGTLLPEIAVRGTLPRIDVNLQGKVLSGSISLAGDLGITDTQGNRQDLQVTTLNVSARTLTLTAEGVQQKYRIELSYGEGKLTGEARSTNQELPRELAKVTQEGAEPKVKYIDSPQTEIWR